jgi:subtilisin family serine protease
LPDSPSRGLGRARTAAALAVFAAVAAALLVALPASGASGGQSKKTYIVQMLADPVVSYKGGIAGYPATKPPPGEKIDPSSTNVIMYVGYLKARHNEALAKVGGGAKLYDYVYSYNGFAAKLTEGQAAKLRGLTTVIAVTADELVQSDTSSTPAFLGLSDPAGLWSQLGGPGAPKLGAGAGEDIIIGVVDSGIWPESKSFTDRGAGGKLIYQPVNTSDWHGKKCADGEAWTTDRCNKKLIGARYYNAGWGGNAALEAERPWEFMSPRDYNGHGTHTSSTAGGNYNTATTGPAAAFGPVSGMAPRARIAMYKALWSTQDASVASGQTSDLVAAIDQAVADGVDVINYSISGSRTDFLNPVSVSMLFAADAGVFVATSAGNNGPSTSTVAHPGPWVTTVAAGTHNRNGIGSVTLGNGVTYNGASVATAVGPAPLIDSTAVGLPGADPTEVALCYSKTDNAGEPVLDPALVAGKIVVCDRGVTARVNKSLAVQEAGGVGMILVNTSLNSINADFHFVPTVHLHHTDRAAVKTYAATSGATATINNATITYNDPAPFTASFSSRGPLVAAGGDLLKPDVIAPGQDILAAVAPPGNAGRDFNLYSGTSMSSPHVAGIAALFKQLKPSWSPMMIKSALMTSAYDVLDGPNTNPLVIFRQGAGHVRPNSAADPGLVYNNGFNDWLAFLCGTGQLTASYCPTIKIDPSNLNVPSIAIGDLAGTQTVTRKVTNVGSSTATYTSSVSGMSGVTTVVTPAQFTLAPGASATFTVDFTRTTATLGSYTTESSGQLTWSDGTHNVRIPIVTRPVALATPAEVKSDGPPVSWDVKTGYNGTLTAAVGGLVPATETAFTVEQDPDQTFDPASSVGTYSQSSSVPANTVFRSGIYEDAITPTGTDLDMYVYRCTGTPETCTLAGQSADGDSNEEVTLFNSSAATFKVYVHGWSTNGPSASGTLFTWQVGTTDAGNTTISGVGPATTGGTQTHTATRAASSGPRCSRAVTR